MSKRIVYIAHPLGAPTWEEREANRANASAWVCWLAANFEIAPVADWIILTGSWPERPAFRERGLAIDCALVARCDELWMVGGRISSGMELEAKHARIVRDLTNVGPSAPVGNGTLARALIAEIVEMS